MANYISKYSGEEIDESIRRIKEIKNSPQEINGAIEYTEEQKGNLKNTSDNELLSVNNKGNIIGTGIINEDDKIFFPKDARFPSASVEIGSATTISENGGWLQYNARTSGKDYILLHYELTKDGTKKPIYWEREKEENMVIISPGNDDLMNLSNITVKPSGNYQINQVYLDFAEPVSNLRIRAISSITGKPIKYLPNEFAWREKKDGMNIDKGVHGIFPDLEKTPFSELMIYNIEFTFEADSPIKVKCHNDIPWSAVDRQKILIKELALMDDLSETPGEGELIPLNYGEGLLYDKDKKKLSLNTNRSNFFFNQNSELTIRPGSISFSEINKSIFGQGLSVEGGNISLKIDNKNIEFDNTNKLSLKDNSIEEEKLDLSLKSKLEKMGNVKAWSEVVVPDHGLKMFLIDLKKSVQVLSVEVIHFEEEAVIATDKYRVELIKNGVTKFTLKDMTQDIPNKALINIIYWDI